MRLIVAMRNARLVAALAFMATPVAAQVPALGPFDGRDLPPVDTGRVRVGDAAPDFTLESMTGGTVTLSQYRGKKNVLLVFYRGHW
jgi:cytochrome oxidase Cu insertion factor (SCO1/SenC/PrrC family)